MWELGRAGRQRGRVHRSLAGVHHRERQAGPGVRLGTAPAGRRRSPALPVVLGLGRCSIAGRVEGESGVRASPEFERGLTSCHELCDEFAGADSAQVARFWTGGDPPPPRAVIPSLVVFASIGSHRRAACGCGLPRTGRPKFRPLDPQAHLGACRRYGDGTNGWRPRGVPHRRSHILDLAGREGGAATPSAAPPPFPASAPR